MRGQVLAITAVALILFTVRPRIFTVPIIKPGKRQKKLRGRGKDMLVTYYTQKPVLLIRSTVQVHAPAISQTRVNIKNL